MIHRTDIIDRVKDLIRTYGARSGLNLKTLQHGLLRDIPQPEDLDSWLPAVLIDVPRITYAEPIADSYPAADRQIYQVVIYYVRRYPADEVTKQEDERGLAELVRIYDDTSWDDRMMDKKGRLLMSALVREVDMRPAEFADLEAQLSDISVSAIRAEVVLIADRRQRL